VPKKKNRWVSVIEQSTTLVEKRDQGEAAAAPPSGRDKWPKLFPRAGGGREIGMAESDVSFHPRLTPLPSRRRLSSSRVCGDEEARWQRFLVPTGGAPCLALASGATFPPQNGLCLGKRCSGTATLPMIPRLKIQTQI
jgi:hypothetical protein